MLSLLFSRGVSTDYPLFQGRPQDKVTHIIDPNQTISVNKSICPCAVSQYSCTPNCCCDPLCEGFYSDDYDNCMPEPAKTLVQMCSDMSKDEVGSVSNWFIRTILCVYRENNPLTKRGEVFSDKTQLDPVNKNSISQIVRQTTTNSAGATVVENPNKPNKTNRGYLFNQDVKTTSNTVANVQYTATGGSNTGSAVPLNIQFGSNIDYNFETDTIDNNTIAISSGILASPYYTDEVLINQCGVPENVDLNVNHYFGYKVNFFFRQLGYRNTAQYIIDSVDCLFSTTELQTVQHPNQLKNHVQLQVAFHELPNSVNMNEGLSETDEESWLPFPLNGINHQ